MKADVMLTQAANLEKSKPLSPNDSTAEFIDTVVGKDGEPVTEPRPFLPLNHLRTVAVGDNVALWVTEWELAGGAAQPLGWFVCSVTGRRPDGQWKLFGFTDCLVCHNMLTQGT